MKGPLEGINILECGQWLQVPHAATLLGNLGAEVIKVEQRETGDPTRGSLSTIGASIPHKLNSSFEYCNLNKRSITIDLRREKGREIIFKLVKKADVFMHNMRSSAAKKLGIDYETMSGHNPRLIYAVGSGWGPKGPESSKPALDPVVVAKSGLMYLSGSPDLPPMEPKRGIADDTGAIWLTLAIEAAIIARERHGIGQRVDVSMFGGVLALQAYHHSFELLNGTPWPRRLRTDMANPLNAFYMCSDETWLMLGMLQADKFWSDFCKAMGIEKLENDPRFENIVVRNRNAKELISILDEIFITKTADQWIKILSENGDFIFAPVQTSTEALNDVQAKENEYVVDFDHPTWGSVKLMGHPYTFSKTPAGIRSSAPEFGQHTEEILLEIGYGWDDIVRLKDDEII